MKHGKGHWAFPKGHPEEGESHHQTAERELQEETGLNVARFFEVAPFKEFYVFKQDGVLVDKMVTYYLAEVAGEVTLQEEEVEEFRWLSFAEAKEVATFDECKELIQSVSGSSALLPG